MNKINNLFEKSCKEIESKMKELFLNKIKIKENIKSINHYENKNIYLDKAINDKKKELNILKQLLLLKEKKKLNFDLIISKYLPHIITSNDENNDNNPNISSQKRVNSLLEGFNNEFNYYLNMNKIKSKKKLHRYNSDLFNKELLKKNHEDYINKNKINNNDKNIIIKDENKIRNISEKHYKNNYNIINYEGNKNFKKSRENLEYYLSQIKEKNNKINFNSFAKILFLKISKYKSNLNSFFLNQLINLYKINKLSDLLCFINIKKSIISKIKIVLVKSQELYNFSKNEEIVDDNEFLNNINLNEFNKENNNNKIFEYINSLEELKDINNKINDLNIRINNFIGKIDEDNQ